MNSHLIRKSKVPIVIRLQGTPVETANIQMGQGHVARGTLLHHWWKQRQFGGSLQNKHVSVTQQ